MGAQKIGRTHLMIRLPEYRAKLAELSDPAATDFLEDCGADARELDRLRAAGDEPEMITLHEEMCQALKEVAVKLIDISRPQKIG